MQRRDFLQLAAASSAGWLAPKALADEFPMVIAGSDHAAMAHHMPAPAAVTPVGGPLPPLPSGEHLPALPLLANDAAESGQFRASLEAAPLQTALWGDGRQTAFWAYNASLPGPLIELWEGDQLEISFRNRLPQPTTVHWHGLPVPVDQDGNPHDPVAPGAQRQYRFTVPEGSAGTYWYHPHPHGHTAEQAFRGLAGALIVRSRNDPLRHLPEQHLLFSDLKLDADGQVAANGAADLHDGREGQYLLINGSWLPVIPLARGERQRWRLWNASSSRILKLALPAHDVLLVGTDGGLLAAPQTIDSLLLAPGERAELVVTGRFREGAQEGLISQPYRRGKMMHAEQRQDEVLAGIMAHGMRPTQALPDTLRSIAPLGEPGFRRRIEFSENMADMNAMFLINGRSYDMNRIDGSGKVGRIEEWEIVGNAHMDHPFHLHGTQFQVLARTVDGVWEEEPFLAWRDVVNVAAGQTVRIRFVQQLPGLRMYHCHILEHEDQGMMAQIDFLAE